MNAGREGERSFLTSESTRRLFFQRGATLLGMIPFLAALGRARTANAEANLQFTDYLDIEFEIGPVTIESKPGQELTTRWDADPRSAGHHFVPLDRRIPFMAGYTVGNDGKVQMWDLLRENGGVSKVGYPITNRWDVDQTTYQAFQNGTLSINSDHVGSFQPYSFGDNPNPDFELPDPEGSTDQVQSQATPPIRISLDALPPLVDAPKYLQIDNLAKNMRLAVGGDGYLLENWIKAARIHDKPIWKLMMDAQADFSEVTGKSLPLPSVYPTSTWDDWASQANIRTVDLLRKAFFANDEPTQLRALAALNIKRASVGLSPARINETATAGAQLSCIYPLINDVGFRTIGENIHLPFQTEWVGYTGKWGTERVRFWADPKNVDLSKIDFVDLLGGGAPSPEQAIESLWASPDHHAFLVQPQRRDFGFASASVCKPGSGAREFHQDLVMFGNIS